MRFSGHAIAFCCALLPLLAQAQAAQAPAAAEAQHEVQLGSDTFSRGEPVPSWVQRLPLPATQRRNPVVTRLADTQFRVSDAHEVFIERAVQVNDSSALARIGQYPIQFVPQYQKLRLHTLQILRGSEVLDRTASANIRFLQREVGLESGMYSGAVTASLLIDDVRVGDTLRIAYSMDGSNPVFGGSYFDAASWDGDEPIELRRAVLIQPEGRNIQWRWIGDFRSERIQPVVSTANGLRTLRFEERGVESLDPEPYIADSFVAWRYLQFSEYGDWSQVARWAETLFPPKPQLPPEALALLAQMRLLPTAQERVLGALQWVQGEIRYFSVSLGESSHRPHDPQWVLQRRYGDCKDKTYLLVSLLQELGIDARPMLVSLQSRRLPGKLMPTPEVFDHVIVRVLLDGKSYYLDGTRQRQSALLDNLGLALDRGFGLVVAPETTALQELVSPQSSALALTQLSERIVLPKIGPEGTLEVRQSWRGSSAEGWRMAWGRWTAEQRRKILLSWYERRYPGIELASEPQAQDDLPNNNFAVLAQFKVPKMAQEFSGDWLVRFSPGILQGLFNLPPSVRRNFPLNAAPYPFDGRYSLSVEWPDSVSVIADPSTRRLSGTGFEAEVTRSFRGARFDYSLRLATLAAETAPKDLPKLVEDIKQLERMVGGTVLVERKSIKDAGFLGLGADTLQSTMRKRIQDGVNRITATLGSGRLAGEDQAEALCDRAEGLADLGRAADGLADAVEAVRIAPALPRAWMCRANLYFDNRDFARAIPDYNRALSLGHSASEVHYHRGLARFYNDQLAQAAEDFARAGTVERDKQENLYPALWQFWTLQRLGRPIPEELQALARKAPSGAWPRPALAMLAGALTPEQVLTEVARKTGDERELTMTEALFYLGQHHLVQGRKSEARDAFQRTRAQGITMFIEHMAAGFELDKMGAK